MHAAEVGEVEVAVVEEEDRPLLAVDTWKLRCIWDNTTSSNFALFDQQRAYFGALS
jgi:hypothetical protein